MDKKRLIFYSVSVFFISLFIFASNIWGLSIYSLDEAKNSECAREMLERGDFIVPTFNYQLRTDKPPLHYYFMMFSYKLFGVNEFSARFFSSVFGALTVLITFLISHRYLGLKTAFLSFMVLISSLHTAIQFHMAVPDPYLIFFINGSLFSFLYGFIERKKVFIYLFYTLMGFGILSKGPVAVVLPSVIVSLYLIFTKNLNVKNFKFLSIPTGLLILLLVALPWYIAVYIKTDGVWIKEFIFKHNIKRFSQPLEGHGGAFIITYIFVIVGLLPFSIFFIQAIKRAFENRKNSLILFSLIFGFVYVIFFSLSKTKLPNYTVPAYPPLAIILAYYLSKIELSKRYSLILSLAFYLIITLAVPIALYFAINSEETISDLNYLSFYFILWFIGGVIGLILIFKRVSYLIYPLSISSILLSLLFFFHIFPKVDNRNPVKQMLPLIDERKSIYYYGSFNPAFVFYMRKEIPPIELSEIERKRNFYIITRKRFLETLKKYPELKVLRIYKDLFEKHYSTLIYKE